MSENLDEWLEEQEFETTEELEVPEKLLDQVIGQEDAVKIAEQAARQKRHVMMIGQPGTGKSMLAKAMTEFLPEDELEDILVYPNNQNTNEPRVRSVPAGVGDKIHKQQLKDALAIQNQKSISLFLIVLTITGLGIGLAIVTRNFTMIFYALLIGLIIFFIFGMRQNQNGSAKNITKLLINNQKDGRQEVPFIDATATHSGALLGDVRHDPFQSGGMETPAHQRVEAGAIHQAHRGVLYIDEINTLTPDSQQHLLTALQDKKLQITGRSDRSSGALVKTEPTPCDFILVAAGNLDAVKNIHPALRSRIRGYGYEIYVEEKMEDTAENRSKLCRFIAQEVKKDGNIPHFTRQAAGEIIREAQKRSGEKGQLTLRLRELGGLVRVAGDLANRQQKTVVDLPEVLGAKTLARGIEHQITDRMIIQKRKYQKFDTQAKLGKVNGLAVLNADPTQNAQSGMVMPIIAEITPTLKEGTGQIFVTGKLGEIAKEAVTNITAVLKKQGEHEILEKDIHVQFIGTYEGVEGDSASISIATAVLSKIYNQKVKQTLAMTGSLSVQGEVLPVGGVTAKIEAAIEAGMQEVIIPAENLKDVILTPTQQEKITIHPCQTIEEVLKIALLPAEQ